MSETNDDAAALIEAIARNGNRSAFKALFDHYAPRIKALLIRRGAPDRLAEDLAQEAMLSVWRKAATFDRNRASAAAWIFTIARNKRIDALRREGRPDYDPADPSLIPAAPATAEQVVEVTQQVERLARAMEVLPEAQAELVRMAYFEDKAHGRIATETGLPLGTVKSRLRLAVGHLRKALNAAGEEDA
ncbi:sigma-70 family RNA polymerase sigma factor [uncultured Nitratireductor sp.]|uniref:sigma-70 family RNA polymerase sigma factor n=1 Tax=uncultured Nitratireductor sp. TaxID=520953 RepID=UPI0025F38C08|nr:sigma-70 family RNA polymerase sigma factor [uncultured Nitratireductor sp.]